MSVKFSRLRVLLEKGTTTAAGAGIIFVLCSLVLQAVGSAHLIQMGGNIFMGVAVGGAGGALLVLLAMVRVFVDTTPTGFVRADAVRAVGFGLLNALVTIGYGFAGMAGMPYALITAVFLANVSYFALTGGRRQGRLRSAALRTSVLFAGLALYSFKDSGEITPVGMASAVAGSLALLFSVRTMTKSNAEYAARPMAKYLMVGYSLIVSGGVAVITSFAIAFVFDFPVQVPAGSQIFASIAIGLAWQLVPLILSFWANGLIGETGYAALQPLCVPVAVATQYAVFHQFSWWTVAAAFLVTIGGILIILGRFDDVATGTTGSVAPTGPRSDYGQAT